MDIKIDIGIGDAYDRLTILQIKLDKIKDANKLNNISKEYDYLLLKMIKVISPDDDDNTLQKETLRLKEVNKKLWDIEDALRKYESKNDFGQEFIELARCVYKLNDERAAIKKTINEYYKSSFIEEKSY
jgi:hypothetical protein